MQFKRLKLVSYAAVILALVGCSRDKPVPADLKTKNTKESLYRVPSPLVESTKAEEDAAKLRQQQEAERQAEKQRKQKEAESQKAKRDEEEQAAKQRLIDNAIRVKATTLFANYKGNEVGSDRFYKQGLVLVQGEVWRVGKDFLNKPYIAFRVGANEIGSVQAMFGPDDERKLSQISPGDTVIIRGKCDGMTVVTVFIKDCVIVSAEELKAADRAKQAKQEPAKEELKAEESPKAEEKPKEPTPEEIAKERERIETIARTKFAFTVDLITKGKFMLARERLKEIIKEYPTTKAAEDAKMKLEEIKDK